MNNPRTRKPRGRRNVIVGRRSSDRLRFRRLHVDPLGNSNSASVPMTVVGPPSITVPASPLTVNENATLVVSGVTVADGFLLTDSSDVQLTLAVGQGALTVSTSVAGGITDDQVSQNSTGTVTILAPVAAINSTLADANGLLYTPTNGYTGADTLTVTASDLGNTALGAPQTSSQSVPVNVSAGQVTPADVAGLQLWLDPTDLSTLKLRDVAGLSASGQGELSRPGVANDPANFHNTDGAGDTQMSVTFWVYFNSVVPDAGILGDSTGATSGSWALTYSSGGNHLRFWEFGGTNGQAPDVIDATSTAFQQGEWYFVALTFDGGQAAASRLHVWIGSVDTTDNGEQLVPQALSSNPTQTDFYAGGVSNPFWIGYGGVNK